MALDTGEATVGWEDFEWVVWRISADDPESRVASSSDSPGDSPDVAGRTRQPMTELAATMGCVYEDCCDDDASEDDVPYYAWWVRLPAAEHARRAANGLPVAVDRMHRSLTAHLPDLPHWEILPDRERTLDHAASTALREAYSDLITPFERALTPLRRDGADALEPRAKVWTWEEELLIGTFDVWLCKDPDRPDTWLVATAGLRTAPEFLEEAAAARLGRYGFTVDHPLLFHPRPTARAVFTARVEAGRVPGTGLSGTGTPSMLCSAHQWTANDPAVLAERVARDVKRLWPRLAGAARRQ